MELHCHSGFSLLDGASTPEALVARAAALGYPALALTDHADLGGIVRFGQAAAQADIGGIIGAELVVELDDSSSHDDGDAHGIAGHVVLLAEDREGYGNLSTLITRARLDRPRGHPAVTLHTLAAHARGLTALTGGPRGLVPSRLLAGDHDGALRAAAALHDVFGQRLAVECWDHGLAEERALVAALQPLARRFGVPWLVANDVRYADPGGQIVHDVLCALRHAKTLHEMGTRLPPNGEWHLLRPSRLRARWRGREQGLRATLAVAERCAFRLAALRPTLPVFPLPTGTTADEYLAALVREGAAERWNGAPSAEHERQLRHELALIAKLGLAGYFLIVWDIVRFARREGILCQGRGSAANSAVCYCLGITAVDPVRMGLLFERFLSEERREAPDIDIDFAHRERERVLQYVYERYGREHAAMVCEQITWREKSALRDASRVLGVGAAEPPGSERAARAGSGVAGCGPDDRVEGSGLGVGERQLNDAARQATPTRNPEPSPPFSAESGRRPRAESRERGAAARAESCRPPTLVPLLAQLPRHRSIHVGGFVLTREPLSTVVPIEPASMPDRTVIQWEKDDLDPVGLIKIDLLGLGMLTLLQDCFGYLRATRGISLDLATIPMDDPAVYDMLCRADTIGVFQVESRAQQNTLPRLKPRNFYDLVVEVALIRPGPIQGDMVHPYLRRRAGTEAVTYPHPALEPILRRTLGIPLFQEQGMQVAIACAGFTPGESDELRRAMGHKRSRERMSEICERLVQGMAQNGIPEETARKIYNQINAFADYGFPESHAASFALLVYASAYLKLHYAPEFTCALLNAQPMGFYSPGTIIDDARRHDVEVLPVDLMRSGWDSSLEIRRPSALGPRRAACGRSRPTASDRRGVPEAESARSARAEGREHARSAGAPRPREPRAQRGAPTPVPGPRPATRDPRATAEPSLRLGLRVIRGLGDAARERLEGALADGPFTSIADVVARTGLDRRALRLLAESGALDGFVGDEPSERRRRVALWQALEAQRGAAGPLAPLAPRPVPPTLPAHAAPELTEADYRLTTLSLNGHPLHHLRPTLAPNGVRTARSLQQARDGDRVALAGLVICRQRPPTAKGFAFLTLEDETGCLNVVVTPRRFERQEQLISTARLLLVRGTLQVESNVVNLRGEQFHGLDAGLGERFVRGHDFR